MNIFLKKSLDFGSRKKIIILTDDSKSLGVLRLTALGLLTAALS